MKERLKPSGKVRLKCFRDGDGALKRSPLKKSNSGSPGTRKSSNMSDSDGEAKELPDNSEDLYKSLLNEEPLGTPSSSQEKGTMTDPVLQKKHKTKLTDKPASAGHSKLNNVLQTISKNKADTKVPLVILSKSSQESDKTKTANKDTVMLNKLQNKNIHILNIRAQTELDRAAGGESGSKSRNATFLALRKSSSLASLKESSLGANDAVTLGGLGNETESCSKNNSSPSSPPPQSSPDFKGFSNMKGKHKVSSNVRSVSLMEKKYKKKLFHSLGKNELPGENESAVLDHPYSHGTPEKGRSAVSLPSTAEASLVDNDYPRYVSRSVFGSPTSSKSPPDIMLHNDKINILRQMSQVFNDEKSRVATKPDQPKTLSLSSNMSLENSVNQKKLSDLDHSSKLERYSKTTSPVIATITPITTIATSANTSTTSTTATTTTTSTAATVTTTATTTTTSSLAVVSISENQNQTDVDSNITNKLAVEPVPKDKEENVIPKKYSTRRSTREEKSKDDTKLHSTDEESHKDNLDGKPVYLVSSHSLEKEESIKVKSYTGSKGEDIDVIDGFTFFSFVTEDEMLNYSPSKSVRRLKPKRRRSRAARSKKKKTSNCRPSSTDTHATTSPSLISTTIITTITSTTTTTSTEDADTSLEQTNAERLSKDSLIESPSKQFEGFTPSSKKPKSLELLFTPDSEKEKSAEPSSAFASNDLDQYLTEHAQLKISFPIPMCKATEEGVTKYDENGEPISIPVSKIVTPTSPGLVISKSEQEPCKPISVSTTKKTFTVPVTTTPVPMELEPPPTITADVKYQPPKHPVAPLTKLNGVGSGLFVKRRGHLLPLSSVVKQRHPSDTETRDTAVEMIYVYHGGRLLTLAGSLTKVSLTNCGAIRARVALPRGHGRLVKHAHRVSSRKVRAVEINEDLAEFALSALKTPTKEEKPSITAPSTNGVPEDSTKYVKPSKENILDILTAKFALDKDSKWDVPEMKPSTDAASTLLGANSIAPGGARPLLGNNKLSSGPVPPSKIMWNQDDILKKKNSTHSTEQSKALRKNINRFPSLSREMKRLNMNFVNCDKESEDEKSDAADEDLGPCSNAFCTLGCVCDSLKCRRRSPDHCGRVDCMFGCSCTVENWKGGHRKGTPINVLSIFNADYERQENLALKEKDFKKTIVQSGSDVFLIGSEKRKRDIRIPQRFKDTNFWKTPFSEPAESGSNNKENVPILPSAYKLHIKDFRLNVPWYDVEGTSVWCMIHSCYDCYCLTDRDFYYDSETTESADETEIAQISSIPPLAVPKRLPTEAVHLKSTLPKSPTENKIVRFLIKLNPTSPSQLGQPSLDRGKIILKHWIHNGRLFCARTCGYVIKDAVTNEMGTTIKDGYNLPVPKLPFIMGITLKKAESEERARKKRHLNLGKLGHRKKATFYDGLGPGLQLPAVTLQTDEFFSRMERGQYPSNIYLKSFEESPDGSVPLVQETTISSVPQQNVSEHEVLLGSRESEEDPLRLSMPNVSAASHAAGNDHKDSEEVLPGNGSVSDKVEEVSTNVDSHQQDSVTEKVGGEESTENGREKIFSLYDMIKEEEKRGELELDLTPKEQGRAILVMESRFRKLINMNIIGITGLNKSGRCNISPVMSSEDLVKMQRIQHLISNDSLDVGPNMREIFSPSSQSEQRVRYVMIRCAANGKWEIVGVVQRKQKDGSPALLPKPKRQKNSRIQMQLTKNGSTSGNTSGSKGTKGKSSSSSGDTGMTTIEGEEDTVTVSDTPSNDRVSTTLPVTSESDSAVPHRSSSSNLVLENAETDDDCLPYIASVHGGSDPVISHLLSSPPRTTPLSPLGIIPVGTPTLPPQGSTTFLPKQLYSKQTNAPLASYVLNQPSAKVFGAYKRNIANKEEISLPHTSDSTTPETLAFLPSDNTFRGTLRFDSRIGMSEANVSNASKIVFYPRPPTPKNLSNNIPRFPCPPASNVTETIKMLLVPSTTSPGKSILIPAPATDVPVSYTLLLRKPDSVVSTVPPPPLGQSPPPPLPLCSNNLRLDSKSSLPLTLLTPALSKGISFVQSSSALFSRPSTLTGKICSTSLVSPWPIATTRLPTEFIAPSAAMSITSAVKTPLTAFPNLTASLKAAHESILSAVPSTNAVAISQSAFNQLRFTCSESSKGLISSPVASKRMDEGVFKDGPPLSRISPPLSCSPDVKCISVKQHDNCTAVDLSIKFKSIKLHWLSGTIKKVVLLNIFKMSRKINAPVSLSAKNDTIQSSFTGMYRFCLDDAGKPYPVLVLGTKLPTVLSMSRLSLREMFRSNTIKYLIKEDVGELSSYTYDVKGISLIKIASKRRDLTSRIRGLGQKVPVEMLREECIPGIEYPTGTHAANQSKPVSEEIVISDDSDEDNNTTIEKDSDNNSQVDKKTCISTSPTRPSRPVLVSPIKQNFPFEESIMQSMDLTTPPPFLSISASPIITQSKRKLEESVEFTSLCDSEMLPQKIEQVKAELDNKTKRFKTTESFDSSSESSSAWEEKREVKSITSTVDRKPVLKIPNPFNKKFPGLDVEDTEPKVSPPKPVLKFSPPPKSSFAPISHPKSPPFQKLSSSKPSLSPIKYVHTMKYPVSLPCSTSSQQSLLKWSIVKSPPAKTSSTTASIKTSTHAFTFKERPGKLLLASPKLKKTSNEGSLGEDKESSSKDDLDPNYVRTTNPPLLLDSPGDVSLLDLGSPRKAPTLTTDTEVAPPVEVKVRPQQHKSILSNLLEFSSRKSPTKGSSDSRPLLSPSKTMITEASTEVPKTPTLLIAGESNSSNSSQEELIDVETETGLNFVDILHAQLKECVTTSKSSSEKPCPLSKKPAHKRAEHSHQNSLHTKTSKAKPYPKLKPSRKPSPTIGQEFQQVFSGAPQFWLMDNTEKHNTLERIRRKGLAKMLENLYTKTINSSPPLVRLPAKHIVLKDAEKLVLSLRAKDISLAKAEISLREKKTQLLNTLSVLLKDTDEDVQREFEQWISTNISNPTAKSKFEDSWKPPKVTFEDEHIVTNSYGYLTVKGTDITSYFATHTAGFVPSKGAPKFRGAGLKTSNLTRRKFMLPMAASSKHHHHHSQQSTKSKLSHLIKSPSVSSPVKGLLGPTWVGPRSISSDNTEDAPDDDAESQGVVVDKDDDSRWMNLVLPPSPTDDLPSENIAGGNAAHERVHHPPPSKNDLTVEEDANDDCEIEVGSNSAPPNDWLQQRTFSIFKTNSNEASCSSQFSIVSEDSVDELKLSSSSSSSSSSANSQSPSG